MSTTSSERPPLSRRGILAGAAGFAANVSAAQAMNANATGSGYQSFLIGDDAAPTSGAVGGGLLLSGGGDWAYPAFRWFAAKAGHGRIIVLRASGTTETADELYKQVGGLTSARTFVFSDRRGAYDAEVLDAVKAADGVFIAGGDQANYVRMWRATPLNAALDAHVRAGKPLGGTSAGLAILGAYLYGSMDGGSITSPEALADPLGKAVTIETDFLHLDLLKPIVTDSHFDVRQRLGRLIAFLVKAQLMAGGAPLYGLGIDEQAAMTIEADGAARLYSNRGGHAWRVILPDAVAASPGARLNVHGVTVVGLGEQSQFNVRTQATKDADFVRRYDVIDGILRQT